MLDRECILWHGDCMLKSHIFVRSQLRALDLIILNLIFVSLAC